jgi:hypothetical protein
MRADGPQGCRSSERRGTRRAADSYSQFDLRRTCYRNRLQVGIDFSQKRAGFCLLFPDGRALESHLAFDNSCLGHSLAKRLLLDALESYTFDGVDVSGEATGYLWLPFFLQLAADPDLDPHDLRLYL